MFDLFSFYFDLNFFEVEVFILLIILFIKQFKQYITQVVDSERG